MVESAVTENNGITIINYRTNSTSVLGVAAALHTSSQKLIDITIARRINEAEIELSGVISGMTKIMPCAVPDSTPVDPDGPQVAAVPVIVWVLAAELFWYFTQFVMIEAVALNTGWSVVGIGAVWAVTMRAINEYGEVVDEYTYTEIRDATPIYEESPCGTMRTYY